MKAYPYFHEGLRVLEASISQVFPFSRLSLHQDSDTEHWTLKLEVFRTRLPPSTVDLSRIVSNSLGLASYTLETHTHTQRASHPRILSALSSREPSLLTTDRSMLYVYMVFGMKGEKKSPLGAFLSRSRAEHVVSTGELQDKIQHPVFSYYTIERMTLDCIVEESSYKMLTKFDTQGNILIRFPEESDEEPSYGRLGSIVTAAWA